MASGILEVDEVIGQEREIAVEKRGKLRRVTRANLQKVLKYWGSEGVAELRRLAEDHVDTLLARSLALKENIAAKRE